MLRFSSSDDNDTDVSYIKQSSHIQNLCNYLTNEEREVLVALMNTTLIINRREIAILLKVGETKVFSLTWPLLLEIQTH
jgi:hypothetical protein